LSWHRSPLDGTERPPRAGGARRIPLSGWHSGADRGGAGETWRAAEADRADGPTWKAGRRGCRRRIAWRLESRDRGTDGRRRWSNPQASGICSAGAGRRARGRRRARAHMCQRDRPWRPGEPAGPATRTTARWSNRGQCPGRGARRGPVTRTAVGRWSRHGYRSPGTSSSARAGDANGRGALVKARESAARAGDADRRGRWSRHGDPQHGPVTRTGAGAGQGTGIRSTGR
jgi:hypothetical protein